LEEIHALDSGEGIATGIKIGSPIRPAEHKIQAAARSRRGMDRSDPDAEEAEADERINRRLDRIVDFLATYLP